MGEKFETFAKKHGSGALDVIDMECKHGTPTGPDKKRVAEVDIDFSHKQGSEQLGKIARTVCQLNDHEIARTMWNVVFAEELLRAIGITHNDPADRRLVRLRDAEGENDNVVLVQKAHDLEEGTNFVLKKNRKLSHLRAVQFLGGGSSGHSKFYL